MNTSLDLQKESSTEENSVSRCSLEKSSILPKENSGNERESWISKWLYKISLHKGYDNLTLAQAFLVNGDLQPVLDEDDRPWRWYNFLFLWVAESFNVNTWQIASTGVESGLSWWETWIAVWVGQIILAIFIFISQRVGAYYHISFPVSSRVSFGIFGSIWVVLNRVFMAIVWYSVQAWLGGLSVKLLLQSIFGADLETRIHNSIPNSGTTTFEFLSYFLFCFLSLPFLYCRPQAIRHLFTVKAYVCSTAGIAFLIWTLVRAKGVGSTLKQEKKLDTSDHAWAFIKAAMSALANFSTFVLNSPDFSRLAKKPGDSGLSQFLAIPFCFSLTSLIGILASSVSKSMYGVTFWSPLDLLSRYVESGTPGDRAGVFFISFAFCLAQLGTNIAGNSISAGTDSSALLPRFVNIRRGAFFCATVAFCLCPWNFFTTSSNFTTYLSAYSVFLSAIAGVIAADYLVVRRGYINIFHLYSNDTKLNYSYNRFGINWRAFVAYICGIAPNFVGFIGACGVKVPIGATYVYNVSFLAGYFTSFIVYLFLVWLSPVKGMPVKNFLTEGGWFEENAQYNFEYFNEESKDYHPDEYVKGGKLF
ncbi:hypothetical protein WICMUC_003109 [Wickerhamomyces mucosus]|uniref:Uracil permease n=1 Tax=Wickerhamomyces mucosus TaxID=1378264 RepID=A0A9P8PM81_9ASCO|nr:hypothetical protein WICMUC_003109 [Wickerhamomyces mucosus]